MFKASLSIGTLLVLLGVCISPKTTQALVFDPGSLIKGKSFSAVYYFAEDGKRYVFPNEKTYFTWYENFNNIIEIDDRTLGTIPIGGNVTYRPGKKMIKITTDPKVYVVDRGGVLRHVASEQLAQTFYNINWSQQIDDLPDPFFINYKIGAPIETSAAYKPSDVLNSTKTISENKGFDSTQAAISIGDNLTGFVPSTITVKKGATVTWTNQDSQSHSVISTTFQSPILEYNQKYQRTFNQLGSYEYNCGINGSMVGTINVIN